MSGQTEYTSECQTESLRRCLETEASDEMKDLNDMKHEGDTV